MTSTESKSKKKKPCTSGKAKFIQVLSAQTELCLGALCSNFIKIQREKNILGSSTQLELRSLPDPITFKQNLKIVFQLFTDKDYKVRQIGGLYCTKIKFSIKDFISKCYQIRRKP